MSLEKTVIARLIPIVSLVLGEVVVRVFAAKV
jgi:hypothetical protein